MFFNQLPTKEASLSYFLGCGSKGKAVAVDVVEGDELWFLQQAEQRNVSITHVIETHVHADHYSGGRKLAQMSGAQYCLHEDAQTKFNFHALKDEEIIKAGNTWLQVMHTPGHTLDSICLLVTDKSRGDDPWFIITGDTLFVGAIGRPDLAGREAQMAGMLYDTLHEKLLTLADNLEIYPAHQAGSVCGAGLSAKPSSTIGFERRFNPGLIINDRAAFIAKLVEQIPPRPQAMDAIVAANTKA